LFKKEFLVIIKVHQVQILFLGVGTRGHKYIQWHLLNQFWIFPSGKILLHLSLFLFCALSAPLNFCSPCVHHHFCACRSSACETAPARCFLRPPYGYYYGIGAVRNEEAAGTINMLPHLHTETLFFPRRVSSSCIFMRLLWNQIPVLYT